MARSSIFAVASAEPAWRAPGRQPAVAEASHPGQGRIAATPDDERDTRRRRRANPAGLEVEERAVAVDGLTLEQASNQQHGHIGTGATGGGIDLADLELVAILATDTDPDGQTSRCDLRQRRDLAGCDHRMAQRQQHHPDLEVEPRFESGDGGQMGQAVDAVAAHEADVISGEHVVHAAIGEARHACSLLVGFEVPQIPRHADADSQSHGERSWHVPKARSMTQSLGAPVPGGEARRPHHGPGALR